MLSLFELKKLLTPQKDSDPEDDFRIIQSWAEYEENPSKPPEERNLEYLCYELEVMNPDTGERTHFYKAMKFARVIRLPANAKQSTAFMDMQEGVLTGVHERNINLITIIANVIKPVAIGLLYLYGVQGVADNIEDAKKYAHHDFLGFIGMMQGTFRVLEMKCAKAEEAEWLREKMYNMDYLTVVRGIPKANKAGEDAGNRGMGGSNLNPDSQGTLEEMITGMADYEYVIEILSTPVYMDTLMGWQRQSQKEMTEWYSQLQGQKSLSMNLSIPMMYMANASQSQGWSKAYTDANTVSYAEGESFGMSQGQSVGQSLSQSFGQSVGHTQGQSLTNSISHGLSSSHGVSFGENAGHNMGIGSNFSEGHNQGMNLSENRGLSEGVNASESHGFGQSSSYNLSHGQNMSQSHNVGHNQSVGYNQSESVNVGNSASYGHSTGSSLNVGRNEGFNYGQNYGYSENHGLSIGSNHNFSKGLNASGGLPFEIAHGGGSLGWSDGTSITNSHGYANSYGGSYGHNIGNSVSNGISESNSVNIGESISHGQSFGQSQSFGASESYGTSVGESMSEGWGVGQSENVSQSIGHSAGLSQSYGKGLSEGASQSMGLSQNEGQSYGRSVGENFGTSQSQTLGQSLGQSVSDSFTQSATTGYGQNVGQSESVSNGQSYTQSNGNSRGMSSGSSGTASMGTASSMGLGPSIGYSKSYQWLDQGVKDLLELMEYQNERLKKALRGQGAFYTYVYVGCPSLDALSTAQAVAKSTWQNDFALVQPLQVLNLTETEQKHLLYHFAAFSADVTREDVFGIEEYKYCTVLLPEEYVAYTHLPRVSEGGVFSIVQDIPKFSVPSMLKGEIYMGTILNPERWTFKNGYRTQFDYRIAEEELMHAFFTGASRSGKTVAALRFIAELSKVRRKKTGKRLRIVALDPKQDWRTLARFVEPERFKFYSMGNLNFRPIKINPWKIPKGVSPQIWIDGIIDIYCRAYGLLERGKQMIADVVFDLYAEAGVMAACNKPDWKETVPELSKAVNFTRIYLKMEEKKNKLDDPSKGTRAGNDTRDAYARLLDRLSCFNREYSIERRLYGTSDGIGIDDLIGDDDVTVLESKGLENTFKNFIFGAITSGFYKYALAHDGGYLAADQYETVLVLEEANEILTGSDVAGTGGGDKAGMSGQSEFEQLLDQAAGYGLFIIAITQKIADMPSSIIANSGLVFAGKLKRTEDINVCVRAVGREERIDDRDLVKWFPRSPIGYFVCQSSRTFDFKDAEPVLVQIARLNINPPSNLELDEILVQKEAIQSLAEAYS